MKVRIEPLARPHGAGLAAPAPPALAQAAGVQLLVPTEAQRRPNWCWAAVTCAIAAYYGDGSWQQPALAWRILCPDQVRPNCAPPPGLLEQERYNQQAPLERSLRYVNCLAGWSSGRPPFRRLIRELDSGRPLAVAIRWRTGSQHYVLLDGYCRHGRMLYGVDPQDGRFCAGFDDFPLHYRHGGEWMETYWTQNPYLVRGETEDE
ncbi:papain-like cysteine protease family protein [Pseudoduganella sp. HUAS MS19]